MAPTVEAVETPIEEVTPDYLIEKAASKYGVSQAKMTRVLECESDLDPKAVGDFGQSIGISQIHLPSHPEITRTQAEDMAFSIDWMAKAWSEGRADQWTCYRLLK